MKSNRKKILKEIIRVNQAGEYGAQQIYAGQIAFTKDNALKKILKEIAKEEYEHLEYFEKLALKKRVRPTLMNVLWKTGGYALGSLTAIMGKNYVMACTEAVEDEIVKHYRNQLEVLQNSGEEEIKNKISKFLKDEDNHRKTGKKNTKDNIRTFIFKSLIKEITKSAIKISKRI